MCVLIAVELTATQFMKEEFGMADVARAQV